MIYSIANNNDIVTLEIPVRNNDSSIPATSVLLTQTFPSGISIYGTPTLTHGSYNTGTKVWTIGTLAPLETAVLVLKIKVEDIDLQPFTITSVVTISETESTTVNNTRYDILKIGEPCVNCNICDPCNFIEPIIILSNDTAGLVYDVAANDIINCNCCQKEFIIVGDPENIIVNSFSNNGILNYTYINGSLSGSLQYRVNCNNCTNGLDYTSDPVTVTFNPIYDESYGDFNIEETQTIDYTQDNEFDYFRFDLKDNAITFTLSPAVEWRTGQKITLYVYDSDQSGPLDYNFIIQTDDPLEVFTETGTDEYTTITSNYTSLTIVYIGGDTFDVI